MSAPQPTPASGRARAFTLVELLVVIGIIALLILILLPALNQARRQAQQTHCISNMRQLGMALVAYVQDNHDWLPYYASGGEGHKFDDWIYWQPSLPVGQDMDSGSLVKYLRSQGRSAQADL